MKHFTFASLLALCATTAPVFAASITSELSDAPGGLRYDLTLTSPASDFFTSFVIPFVGSGAIAQVDSVAAPFAWTGAIVAPGDTAWGYSAAADGAASGYPGGGRAFENPDGFLLFQYDTASYRDAQTDVEDAEAEVQRIEGEIGSLQADLTAETDLSASLAVQRKSLRRELALAEQQVEDADSSIATTRKALTRQDLIVQQIEDDIASNGSTPEKQAELAAAQAERDGLQEALQTALQLAKAAQGEVVRLTNEIAALDTQLKESRQREAALESVIRETENQLASSRKALLQRRAVADGYAETALLPGATVSGFSFESVIGPVAGPVRVDGSESGRVFSSAQVPGTVAPIPLPAGIWLLLGGLTAVALGSRAARRGA